MTFQQHEPYTQIATVGNLKSHELRQEWSSGPAQHYSGAEAFS